jgi:hypothetical protein
MKEFILAYWPWLIGPTYIILGIITVHLANLIAVRKKHQYYDYTKKEWYIGLSKEDMILTFVFNPLAFAILCVSFVLIIFFSCLSKFFPKNVASRKQHGLDWD